MYSCPMLLVTDVKQSAAWYSELFGAKADHGLDEFDQITRDGELLLMLHRGSALEHGAKKPKTMNPGKGVLLWFFVQSVKRFYNKAKKMNVDIVLEPHQNQQAGWTEMTIRDPDGYLLAIAEF